MRCADSKIAVCAVQIPKLLSALCRFQNCRYHVADRVCIAAENRAKLYRQGIDTSMDYNGWLARQVAATLKGMMVSFW